MTEFIIYFQGKCAIHLYIIFKFESPMLFSKALLDKKITQYQLTHLRVDAFLGNIKSLIYESLKNNASFSACNSCLQKYLQRARQKYNKQDYFPMIKLNMLLHSLLLEQQLLLFQNPERSEKLLQIISIILNRIYTTQSSILKGTNERKTNYLKVAIHNYVMYLQKKSQALEQALQEFLLCNTKKQNIRQNIQQASNDDKKEDTQNQTIQPIVQLERHYSKCYISINLINSCTKIADKIHGIIRYYGDKYKFITDLNILLAVQLQPQYEKLRKQFMGIKQIEGQAQLESFEYFQLLKQIQNINEKLYVIFLNRYNYFHLSKYTPNWIQQAYKSSSKVSWSTGNFSHREKDRKLSLQSLQTSTNHDTSIEQNINSRQFTLSDIEVPSSLDMSCNNYSPVVMKSQKQIQMINLLSDLTLVFKKSLSQDEQVKICKTSRVKKSKSFYEMKSLMKSFRV